jgi:hypothetical protein
MPAAAPTKPETTPSRITDKAIPAVTERTAFRNFGYGLSKTSSRDKGQLRSLSMDWIAMANDGIGTYRRSLRDGEIIDLEAYQHYKGLYELVQKLEIKNKGWSSFRDKFFQFLSLPAEPTRPERS